MTIGISQKKYSALESIIQAHFKVVILKNQYDNYSYYLLDFQQDKYIELFLD